MSTTAPKLPQFLTPIYWKSQIVKNKMPVAKTDIESDLVAVGKAYSQTKWSDLGDDTPIDDFDKIAKTTLTPLIKALLALIDSATSDKTYKGTPPAKLIAQTANDLLEEIDEHTESARKDANQTSVKNTKEVEAKKEEEENEDDDDKDSAKGGYSLKKALKLVRSSGKNPLKFGFCNCSSGDVEFQLFIGKRPINKKFVAEFESQCGKIKIIAKGLVSFEDKTFTFALPSAPTPVWEKRFAKILKSQGCGSLGGVALRQMGKDENDDDEQDEETTSPSAGKTTEEADEPKAAPDKDIAQLPKKLKELAALIPANGDRLVKSEMASLVRRADRQLKDRQFPQAREAIKELEKIAATLPSKKDQQQIIVLNDILKKLILSIPKDADKLAKSEMGVLAKRAQRQIAETALSAAGSSIKEFKLLIDKTNKAMADAKKTEAAEAAAAENANT